MMDEFKRYKTILKLLKIIEEKDVAIKELSNQITVHFAGTRFF